MLRNLSDTAILAAILLLAILARAVGLNQPLWYDEVITLFTHLKLPWSDMMSGYEMNHHYLFSFQSKAAIALFGEAPWAVRLPAVIFGVGSIWATWVLVRDTTNTKIAHITALLLAISYHHIWFSQNARGYTELMFWGAVATILFLRGLKNPKPTTWGLYALTLALSVFTHLTGLFFFIAHGIVWLGWLAMRATNGSLTRQGLMFPAVGYLGGLILCLILYAPILPGIFDNANTVSGTSQVDRMTEYQNPIWTVLEAIRTVAGGLGPLVSAVALLVVALATLGGMRITPLFSFIVLTHIILTMALLLALGMRIWPRFFFVDIGMLLALIVLGVNVVTDIAGRILPQIGKKRFFELATTAMVLVSLGLAAQNYRAPKQNIPGPQALIDAEASDGDQIHAVGFVANIYTDHLKNGWGNIKTGQELSQALATDAPVWLVVGFPARTFRAVDGLEAAVEDFELIERFPGTLGDGAMLVYRRAAR